MLVLHMRAIVDAGICHRGLAHLFDGVFSTGLEIQLREETGDSTSRLTCILWLGRSFDSLHLDILRASMLTWSGASTILQGELIATDAGQNCDVKRRSIPLNSSIQRMIIVLVYDVSRSLVAWRPVWRNSFLKQRKDNQEKESRFIQSSTLFRGLRGCACSRVYEHGLINRQLQKKGPGRYALQADYFAHYVFPGTGTACLLIPEPAPLKQSYFVPCTPKAMQGAKSKATLSLC